MKAQELFDSLFKFKNNQSVKHRGDHKGNMSSDMGLLILHRALVEDVNADGVFSYERNYHCRVIRFSGSGDVMNFKETELMSQMEYEEEQIKSEATRNQMREDMKRLQQEIYKGYGVSKDSTVTLKTDPEKEFRVCGFEGSKGTGKYHLRLREIAGIECGREDRTIESKQEIEKVI